MEQNEGLMLRDYETPWWFHPSVLVLLWVIWNLQMETKKHVLNSCALFRFQACGG